MSPTGAAASRAHHPAGRRLPSAPSPSVQALSVGILSAVVALVVEGLLTHQVGLSGDEPYYSRIADHPAGPHNFPYAFRFGLPYIVHVLPLSHALSWELLALVCSGAASAVLFVLMRDLRAPAWLAAWLSVGFVVSPPLLVVFLRNGREVDAAATLILCLGALFIVRRRRLALAITLLAGSTVHEACLFLIPFAYAFWADRLIDRAALRDLALVATLPLLAYLEIRTSIATVGRIYQPGYNGPFLSQRIDVVHAALAHGGWRTELRRIALSFGPLWLVAAGALRDLRLARRGLVLLALCVGATTFAFDWGRLLFFSAPVIYASAAHVLRTRRRLAVVVICCLLAMDLGYAVYMQVHGVRYGLDSHGPPARGPVT